MFARFLHPPEITHFLVGNTETHKNFPGVFILSKESTQTGKSAFFITVTPEISSVCST